MGLTKLVEGLTGPDRHRYILTGVLLLVYSALAAYWVLRQLRKARAKNAVKHSPADDILNLLGPDGLTDDLTKWGGRTDKYEWSQTAEEVEMYIPVAADVRGHDVQCKITKDAIKMKVKGEWVLKGELHQTVKADDSSWQIETDKQRGRVVWVNLTKEKPTEKGKHWRGVIKGDPEIASNVHTVDPSDPEALKRVIDGIKKNA